MQVLVAQRCSQLLTPASAGHEHVHIRRIPWMGCGHSSRPLRAMTPEGEARRAHTQSAIIRLCFRSTGVMRRQPHEACCYHILLILTAFVMLYNWNTKPHEHTWSCSWFDGGIHLTHAQRSFRNKCWVNHEWKVICLSYSKQYYIYYICVTLA